MEWKEIAQILLTLVVGIIGSSGFWAYKTKKLERKYQTQDKSEKILETVKTTSEDIKTLLEKHDKTNEVTMAVARDRIYYLCDKAITNRDFRHQTMRDIRSIMEPYKANGGDGLADEFFDKYEHMYKTNSSSYFGEEA